MKTQMNPPDCRELAGSTAMASSPAVPEIFTIHIGAPLGPRWSDWLGGAEFIQCDDSTGMVTVTVPDQAMLFGILLRIRDLGVPLLGLYPASVYAPR